MIDFFYYKSPNCRKVLIALEELGLSYTIRWIELASGEQHHPDFVAISPGAKVPAIVDRADPGEPVVLFESAAILQYLADRSGRLLPAWAPDRYRTLSWLSWQVGSQGPMLGQATHFQSYARSQGIEAPYASERYAREARRCYETMEAHLAGQPWFGPDFSIADIALFPWTRTAKGQGIDLSAYPAVQSWSNRIAARPSAQVKPSEDAARGAMAGRDYSDARSNLSLFGDAFVRRTTKGH